MNLRERLRALAKDNPLAFERGTLEEAAAELDQLADDLRNARRERDEWHGRSAEAVQLRRERDEAVAKAANQQAVASAVQCLRDIAAMGKKAGSETAHHWLLTHGYPLEEGGYVPGRGFSDAPEHSFPREGR